MVRGSFKARRKTLWNNLQNLYGKEPEIKERLTKALDAATIKPSQRAEQLSISDFARLTEALLVEGFK